MCIRPVERGHAALLAALTMLAVPGLAISQSYPSKFNFGVPASSQDIESMNIAIAPDGKNVPAGRGDWAAGKKVYETKCGACHGANLQGVAGLPSMPAGAALIGGRGTLATKNPGLTVESYWPYATTLFDYIRRAMPYTTPGSLTAGENYPGSAPIPVEGKIIHPTKVVGAPTLPPPPKPQPDR